MLAHPHRRHRRHAAVHVPRTGPGETCRRPQRLVQSRQRAVCDVYRPAAVPAETSYGILRRVTDAEPATIRELNTEIPDWLERLIRRMHAKLPGDRFQTVEQVAELLEQCLAHVQQPSAVPLPEESGQDESAGKSNPNCGSSCAGCDDHRGFDAAPQIATSSAGQGACCVIGCDATRRTTSCGRWNSGEWVLARTAQQPSAKRAGAEVSWCVPRGRTLVSRFSEAHASRCWSRR